MCSVGGLVPWDVNQYCFHRNYHYWVSEQMNRWINEGVNLHLYCTLSGMVPLSLGWGSWVWLRRWMNTQPSRPETLVRLNLGGEDKKAQGLMGEQCESGRPWGCRLGEETGQFSVIRVGLKRRNQLHPGYQGKLLGGGVSELGLAVWEGVFWVKQSRAVLSVLWSKESERMLIKNNDMDFSYESILWIFKNDIIIYQHHTGSHSQF